MVNKPYGVSCLGYRQADGGVFKQSRYDKRNNTDIDDCSRRDDSVTLDDALPYLKRKFNESNLQFCMGLKRCWNTSDIDSTKLGIEDLLRNKAATKQFSRTKFKFCKNSYKLLIC